MSKMLLKLVINPSNFCLTTRLMSLTSFSVRFPEKLIFFDASKRKAGRNSFLNRAKRISKLIPFEWLNLILETFTSTEHGITNGYFSYKNHSITTVFAG